jgi:hypothetical protein
MYLALIGLVTFGVAAWNLIDMEDGDATIKSAEMHRLRVYQTN